MILVIPRRLDGEDFKISAFKRLGAELQFLQVGLPGAEDWSAGRASVAANSSFVIGSLLLVRP